MWIKSLICQKHFNRNLLELKKEKFETQLIKIFGDIKIYSQRLSLDNTLLCFYNITPKNFNFIMGKLEIHSLRFYPTSSVFACVQKPLRFSMLIEHA